ncbi:response regulator [Pseudomonas sp. NPDC086278]|uniref:response regulator n=1 Tax=Pseudomonas sp. NPDC086278 TaxID=3390646 RepID=UPI003D074D92
MNTTSILLIDDHALFRSGIAMVLETGLENMRVFEAGTLQEALRLEGCDPALVLLDVQLQGVSGLEGIGSLKRKWPLTRIVVVSAFDLPQAVIEAVEHGAAAFISKTEKAERMLELVRALLDDSDASTPSNLASNESNRPRLTPRQCEVLDLLCQGLSNKMIGRKLDLSEHTVRGHVQAMLATLRVSSRSEATYAARRLGLVR